MQLNFVAFTNKATFAQEIWETRIKDADQKVSCLPGLSSHGHVEYFHKIIFYSRAHTSQSRIFPCLFVREANCTSGTESYCHSGGINLLGHARLRTSNSRPNKYICSRGVFWTPSCLFFVQDKISTWGSQSSIINHWHVKSFHLIFSFCQNQNNFTIWTSF